MEIIKESLKHLDFSVDLLNKLNISGVQNAMILATVANSLTEVRKQLDEYVKESETASAT